METLHTKRVAEASRRTTQENRDLVVAIAQAEANKSPTNPYAWNRVRHAVDEALAASVSKAVRQYRLHTRHVRALRRLGNTTQESEAQLAVLADKIWRTLSDEERQAIETWLVDEPA